MNFLNYCCYQQKRRNRRVKYKGTEEAGQKLTSIRDIANLSPSSRPRSMDSISHIYLTMLSGQCDSPHQDMLVAVLNNDPRALQRLIDNQVSNSWTDIFQFVNGSKRVVSPMELACTLGYVDMVKLFLENGCSPNLPTTSGRLIHTILESLKSDKITLKDGKALVKRLCNDGCNVNIVGQNHKTPLLHAAELGDVEILETLLTVADPLILNHGDIPNGFTPLHMSAMRGDLDCVLAMLKYCSNHIVNMLDIRQCTALKLALVSMYKNLMYMNSLMRDSKSKMATDCPQMQTLRQLQYNSIAIVEALLLHGAKINNDGDWQIRDTLLYQALLLVCNDETCEKFRHDKYSHTMQLVASTKLQDLNGAITGSERQASEIATASAYSGIVRLFVLYGADPVQNKDVWLDVFRQGNEVHQLIDEIFYFWDNKLNVGPPKLIQLSKQVIRTHLAGNQTLHKMDLLPLPSSLIAFIKLQCL